MSDCCDYSARIWWVVFFQMVELRVELSGTCWCVDVMQVAHHYFENGIAYFTQFEDARQFPFPLYVKTFIYSFGSTVRRPHFPLNPLLHMLHPTSQICCMFYHLIPTSIQPDLSWMLGRDQILPSPATHQTREQVLGSGIGCE